MKILIKLRPFCSSAHFDLVSKMSQKVLQARVLKYYMLIGDGVEIT